MVRVFDLPLDVMRLVFAHFRSIYDFDAIAQLKEFEAYIVDYFVVLTDTDADDFTFHGVELKKVNLTRLVNLGSDGGPKKSQDHLTYSPNDLKQKIYEVVNQKEFFIINSHYLDCSVLNIIPHLLVHKKCHTINFCSLQPGKAEQFVFYNRPYISNIYNSDDSSQLCKERIDELYVRVGQKGFLPFHTERLLDQPPIFKGPVRCSWDSFESLKSLVFDLRNVNGETLVIKNLVLPNLKTLEFSVERFYYIKDFSKFSSLPDCEKPHDTLKKIWIDQFSPSIGIVDCEFPKLKELDGNFEFIARSKFESLQSLKVQYVKFLLLQDIYIPHAKILSIMHNDSKQGNFNAPFDLSYAELQNILERWHLFGFPTSKLPLELIPGEIRQLFEWSELNNINASSLSEVSVSSSNYLQVLSPLMLQSVSTLTLKYEVIEGSSGFTVFDGAEKLKFPSLQKLAIFTPYYDDLTVSIPELVPRDNQVDLFLIQACETPWVYWSPKIHSNDLRKNKVRRIFAVNVVPRAISDGWKNDTPSTGSFVLFEDFIAWYTPIFKYDNSWQSMEETECCLCIFDQYEFFRLHCRNHSVLLAVEADDVLIPFNRRLLSKYAFVCGDTFDEFAALSYEIPIILSLKNKPRLFIN